jgi:hypothetical protein
MDLPEFDWHLQFRPPLGTRPGCPKGVGRSNPKILGCETMASRKDVPVIPTSKVASCGDFLTARLSFEDIPEGGIIASPHRPRDALTPVKLANEMQTKEAAQLPVVQKPKCLRSTQSDLWEDQHKPLKNRKRSLRGKKLGTKCKRPGKSVRGSKVHRARKQCLPQPSS